MSRDRLTAEEAAERAARVSAPAYEIHLDLDPAEEAYRGRTSVRFHMAGDGGTFLELAPCPVDRLELNGRRLPPPPEGSPRIELPGEALEEHNLVEVEYRRPYDRTGEGLHRFEDPEDGSTYLYTQFEPYMAHRVFPCFDQPDLKATYRLTVTAPRDWEVVSNSLEEGREEAAGGRLVRRFEETLPFSPYLVALVAGPFGRVDERHGDLQLGLLARRSLFRHLDPEEVLEVTRQGLDFFSEFFDRPYPFTKYDQVFVPEFNWGGMENVAAVTYSDRAYVFRDPPTQNERLRRAEVLLHELAHMWFGDLVTMRWWDDLWLNESFATYMAYLALEEATRFRGSWQSFLARMKVWAQHQDEMVTTHPIADRVPSTDETFLNFDGISYGKGASVLKQLVAAVGMDAFRDGMRLYFRRHAFGNADLGEFLAALQEGSGLDLEAWARVWLETSSINRLQARPDGPSRLRIVQSAAPDHPVLRPHRVTVALVGEDRLAAVPASIEGEEAEVEAPPDAPRPALVYPNHEDHAYAKVSLDPESLAIARRHLAGVEPPLLRQLLWTSLWTMVRDRELSSLDFLSLVERHLVHDRDLQVLQMVIALAVGDFTSRKLTPPVLPAYVPEERWEEQGRRFVAAARAGLEAAPQGDARALWLRGLIGQATDHADLELAARLVDGAEGVPGLPVDQEMRWEVAVRWTAHGMAGAEERLEAERGRDLSDRGERQMIRAAASRPDPDVKAEVWEKLHTGGYGSLHQARAAMAGFTWPAQRRLLAPYTEELFSRLGEVFESWEPEAAKQYFLNLFPHDVGGPDVVEHARRVLAEQGDRHPMLRRLLLEAIDETERALACRAHAARGD